MIQRKEGAAFSGSLLQVKLEGASIQDGSIRAADLSSPPDSLNQLLQTASKEVYGKDSNIELRFNGSEKGSFIADCIVIGADIAHFSLAHKEYIDVANSLLDLLFKCGTLCGGTIALLKWLKGKKPDKTERKGDHIHIHSGDISFITSAESLNLANSPKTRAAAQKLTAATAKKGIDSLSLSVPHSRAIKLRKEDIDSFAVPDEEMKPVLETERETLLEIISLNFENPQNWLFSEGNKPSSAAIADEHFIGQVKKRQISFRKGDYVKCLIKEKQYSTIHGLRKETEIIKIIKFIDSKSPKQLSFF